MLQRSSMLPRSAALPRLAMLLAVLVLAGAAPSAAQQPIPFDSVAALPARPPDHRVAYGPGPLQFGHLRLPKGPGPHPVVLFVHGGCYLSQYSIGHAGALEQALADSGFAVWSIEYRRVGDDGGGWPGTYEDVGLGADHLRALAKRHPLDLGRVVAMGHSAGANFALWLATRDRLLAESPLRAAKPLRIGAVLALAPVPDLAAMHAKGVCGNVIDRLLGGSPERYPERYADASPAQRMPIGVPQILVVGGQDRAWGPFGRGYHAAAVAAGDSLARLVDAPASGHFDMIAPPTATWAWVIDALRTLMEGLKPQAPR